MVFKDRVEFDDQSLGTLVGDQATVKVRFPKRGEYEVVLVASPPSEKRLREVARFKVKATDSSKISFPKLYGDFSGRQCRIIEGFDGVLKANKSTRFKFYVPGALAVEFKDSGGWTKLKSQGGELFALDYAPPPGGLRVLARFDKDNNRLPVLLEYEVH
jgi:hypothetical protein